jgi:predicted glycogen debranching enzyme
MSNSVWPQVRVDGDIDRTRVEWVHANGAGGYASSTIARLHTRRYHGLLVAALEPPRKRHVILSHVDATLRMDGASVQLATHQFPGVPPIAGYRLLEQFSQDPLPRWTYRVHGGEFEHALCLARGANAVVLRYTWNGPRPLSLELRPLLALRAFHGLVREHGAMVQRVEMRQNEVSVRPVPSLPRVVFRHRGIFVGSPDWWRRFEYLAEQARGLDFQEDLWTPGVFRIELQPGAPAHLVCGVDRVPDRMPEEIMQETSDWLRSCDPGPQRAWSVRQLSIAADAFRADLAPIPGVIAGYPWFELWGRHTLLSLPGLYLVQGHVEQAQQVVLSLIQHMRDGLVPNRLPDDGSAAEYHAVDATLLLFDAARRIAKQSGATDPFVTSTLLPALTGIFEALSKGTRDGIHVTSDGLLAAGDHSTSLTWMDARVDGIPVTSRGGLPVEVQALWTQACDTLSWLAAQAGDEPMAKQVGEARDRAREAFRRRFWCEQTRYPYDFVSEEDHGPGAWADPSIRPNALAALAIDPELFSGEQAQQIIARAQAELLTPAGLRTLSAQDPHYRPTYNGGVAERDGAYHQGTVWPFLMGIYSRAVHHTYPGDVQRADAVRAQIEAMLTRSLALGQVSEIADGDAPHRPNGCVAQAVSVAELLRALVEDLGL